MRRKYANHLAYPKLRTVQYSTVRSVEDVWYGTVRYVQYLEFILLPLKVSMTKRDMHF